MKVTQLNETKTLPLEATITVEDFGSGKTLDSLNYSVWEELARRAALAKQVFPHQRLGGQILEDVFVESLKAGGSDASLSTGNADHDYSVLFSDLEVRGQLKSGWTTTRNSGNLTISKLREYDQLQRFMPEGVLSNKKKRELLDHVLNSLLTKVSGYSHIIFSEVFKDKEEGTLEYRFYWVNTKWIIDKFPTDIPLPCLEKAKARKGMSPKSWVLYPQDHEGNPIKKGDFKVKVQTSEGQLGMTVPKQRAKLLATIKV